MKRIKLFCIIIIVSSVMAAACVYTVRCPYDGELAYLQNTMWVHAQRYGEYSHDHTEEGGKIVTHTFRLPCGD